MYLKSRAGNLSKYLRKFLFKTTEFDVEKSLPDATFCCAKDGKIQWVNDKAAEVFETSKMHLLTSNINDFIENALLMVQNAISRDSIIITKSVNAEIYYDMTAKEIEEGLENFVKWYKTFYKN